MSEGASGDAARVTAEAGGGCRALAAGGEDAAGRAARRGSVSDHINVQAGQLLRRFILDRAESETETVGPAPTLEELGGSPAEQEDKGVIEVANCLRLIGDELDRDQKLQEMIRNMPIESPRELFMRVAIQIFADGTFNWGRVVALFYFAYRLVMKAYSRQLLDIVKTIISWAVDFIRENVIQWIREQGGWEGVRTYFGTQTWHSLTMFAAGALVSALVLWRIR
ncbi:apoptosis regulator BAX isoform X1 [Lethenteron reissneri]|uniref:apoptosis regulator BAX isoform X1 n=1 Tax=Lethenteron reissneri TaxID=7753 RepID=UPI002AB61D80|nr:apoptosis regulator BAX isoform X1 [Lethenteron reissneri]XP_061416015.1 apoptosis regulator BAX isoform X1 [Lethenteron reissneri]